MREFSIFPEEHDAFNLSWRDGASKTLFGFGEEDLYKLKQVVANGGRDMNHAECGFGTRVLLTRNDKRPLPYALGFHVENMHGVLYVTADWLDGMAIALEDTHQIMLAWEAAQRTDY